METIHREHEAVKIRSRQTILVLLGALLCVGTAPAQQLRGLEILQKVEQNFTAINDFIVDLEVDVNMDRLRMPRMKATMYFKQADKLHFDAPEFAMIPRDGVFLNPRLLRERYDVVLAGEESIASVRVHKLQLAAKEVSARVRQMYVFVDPSNWTIVKMEMAPFPGRVVMFDFVHERQKGDFWMPTRLVASFSTAEPDTTAPLPELAQEVSPRYNEMRGPLRSGSITIVYSRYRINVGLSDDIFSTKNKEK